MGNSPFFNLYATLILCIMFESCPLYHTTTTISHTQNDNESTPLGSNQNNTTVTMKSFEEIGRELLQDEAPYILRYPIIIPAISKHTATVIFLHGRGDTGFGLESTLQSLRQPYMKVVCPTANVETVSPEKGIKKHSWYTISNNTENKEVEKAVRYVHGLIDTEIKIGIPAERIMLGGFAQGGVLAWHSAKTYPKRLGGIIAYSTSLLKNQVISKSNNQANKNTPVLYCWNGESAKSNFSKISGNVKFKSNFGSEDPITEMDLREIKEFMQDHVGPPLF